MNKIVIILLSILSFNVYSMNINQELIDAACKNNIDRVKELIESGASVNAKNILGGYASLHYAAINSNKNLAELLISNGADVDARDNYNATALLLATQYGFEDIAQLLINKDADINTKDKDGYAPLHVAAVKGNKDITELLINNGADISPKISTVGYTPLCLAIKENNKVMVELLLEAGADKSNEINIYNTARYLARNPQIKEIIDNYVPIPKR